jgi:peptide/nickel transport system permease protein
MAVARPGVAGETVDRVAPPSVPQPAAPAAVPAKRSEFVYFALRNWKFVLGAGIVLVFLLTAAIAPALVAHPPLAFTGPTDSPPSSEYWFGTTSFGQDVFSQFVNGLRAAFLVGAVGGGIAWVLGAAVGFTAGYRGGWLDDLLNMLTNVVLVIPTLAILIIVAAYIDVHSYVTEALLIGLTSWPWAARAVRAQTSR